MRTTRVLAIIAILGIAFSFRASANVVYDSETTNEWFNAHVATSSELASNWTRPEGGEAVVKGGSDAHYIALDTDFNDPLTYAATDASADIAVVAAEMTATVNATEPQIGSAPQAALAVIGNATATNWVGLVGNGSGGTEWVTFPSPVPVAGNSYSVRIEFDQRQGKERRIRYLVDGRVLLGEGSSNGWYPNPQAGAANISNVSFFGSGDIRALAGENITENTIAFNAPTQTNGFDYTNGAISVSAAIQGYTGVTATLTVKGTDGEKVKVVPQTPGSANWSWNLNDLTQGGVYSYTIEAQVGGKVIATKTGTFTAANWPANIWFGADASKAEGSRETGGSWDPTKKPAAVEDNAYVIEDDALFNVTDQKPGSNHVTRVDTIVTFETLVDSSALEIPEDVALGGFVAAKSGENPQWMALTAGTGDHSEWVALTGGVAPEVNVQYVIRAEVDFISDTKRVRFLVSNDDGETFHPLSGETSQWIDLATQEKYSLAAVELKGSGRVAKFEAMVADKALAVVNGVEYDDMAEALAAAKDNGKEITLLTNATVEPKDKGTYEIAPNNYHYVSGGKVSTDTTNTKTIVIDDSGEPKVRPSTEEMNKVTTPGDKSYKNINSLRAFLEKHGVAAYTGDLGSAAITQEMNGVPTGSKNNLPLWQDYVMGVEPTDSVTPEYTPSADKETATFNLQVPALGAAIEANKPSGDYAIKYRIDVNKEAGTSVKMTSGIIPVTLPNAATDYKVSIVLEPIE